MSVHKLSRRKFLRSLGAAGGAIFLSSQGGRLGLAVEDNCPQVAGKKVRWIVPGPAGGSFDIYSRLISSFYEKKIGTKMVFDYVVGAGGILGAKALKEAPPDGLTLGLMQVPGFLVAAMTGQSESPNPVEDFTILARAMKQEQIWATSRVSPLKTIEDVFAEAQKRPILFCMSDVGSLIFVETTLTSTFLGLNHDFISGYKGSRGGILAAMRGEVDIISFPFDSLRTHIEEGDLRPLLQISLQPVSSHTSLEGVPLLGGDNGLAARRAVELGRDVKEAKADVEALVGLIGGGRVVAAPPGLEEGLFNCLEQKLHETLTDPAFEAAAAESKLSLDVARADEALNVIKAAAKNAEKFIPIIKAAIKKAQR